MAVKFKTMQKELMKYDKAREEMIKQSRDVLKLSKLVIYAVHRSEMKKAVSLLSDIEKARSVLDKIVSKIDGLQFEGSYKAAISEYVEAVLYLRFVESGKLCEISGVSNVHYLLGLADLPGELVRRAVYLASKGEISEVAKIRDAVDMIYGEMLAFNFGNGELRKKTDGIKYSLNKLEDLMLDLKLRG